MFSEYRVILICLTLLLILLAFGLVHFKNELALKKLTIEQLTNQLAERNEAFQQLQQKVERAITEEVSHKLVEAEKHQIEKSLDYFQSALSTEQSAHKSTQEMLQATKVELAQLQMAMSKIQESHEEKLSLLEKAKVQMTQEFQVLAQQVLEAKQANMTEQSKALIGGLIQPMQSVMTAFKERIELVHKEDLEGRASLTEQLKQLQALNLKMSDEAKNLTQALKGDSKLQGNWGEMILEKLLESSGLREGVEFIREASFVDEAGKRLRPDVVINLPEQKHIVIDSKVSLKAYEQAVNAQTETLRKISLKEHLDSLSRHIQTLATKRYQNLSQLQAPDFILMFIPVEGAYLMAIEADPSIFENAFESQVAVVTPTTLFTTLKTIEQLWRHERHSEHTLALVKRAADVHDKFVGFLENFEKVGKQLGLAQSTYEAARKQMMSGSGNLIRQAEMLKELAGKTKKEMPSHLLVEAEAETAGIENK